MAVEKSSGKLTHSRSKNWHSKRDVNRRNTCFFSMPLSGKMRLYKRANLNQSHSSTASSILLCIGLSNRSESFATRPICMIQTSALFVSATAI